MKFKDCIVCIIGRESRPSRGAWIEMGRVCRQCKN